jgi:predicted DNA-binding transcriptional regulator AlpA
MRGFFVSLLAHPRQKDVQMSDKKKRNKRRKTAPDAIQLPAGATRLIDKKELLAKVPLSYPAIWHRMRLGEFPHGVAVGSRTFWREDEVDQYIAALPRRRLKGDTAETVEA